MVKPEETCPVCLGTGDDSGGPYERQQKGRV